MPNSASSFVEVNTGSNTLNNNSVENDVMPSGLWESHANVDRQWLSKLLQKNHAGRSSKEKQQSSALNETYPILRGKALAVAPMVEQSDLPFRLLCREYGANLCYTPMINARYFVQNSSYRRKMFNFDNGSAGGRDRPLIAQLCANNKEILLQGAKLLECHVDAVDLNCGCPTKVAKRGRFGAYLLESGEYLVSIVKHLAENLSIPVTVKVRLLPHQDINKSLDLYRKLVDAGAALLTVHGRTRYNKGENTSRADWDAIRKVVKSVGDRVPVIANGSISSLDDACACLTATGADGVMSSEAILEYPALYLEAHTAAVKFRRTGPGRLQIAREYLARCREFPPEEGGGGTKLQCIKRHLQVFCHEEWKDQPTLHDALFPVRRHAFEELVESHGTEWNYFCHVLDQVEAIQRSKRHRVEDERLSWYFRHRVKES